MSEKSREEDPRPVSDYRLREEHGRQEVEGYRARARRNHRRWLEVMKNRYGRD